MESDAKATSSLVEIGVDYRTCCIGAELPSLLIKDGIAYERNDDGTVWAWDVDEFLSLTAEERQQIGVKQGNKYE